MDQPYQYASVILGPYGLGKELGRSLFGGGGGGGGGEAPPSPVAGAAAILLTIGAIGIAIFAIHSFSTHGGAKLFK